MAVQGKTSKALGPAQSFSEMVLNRSEVVIAAEITKRGG